jgi:hypothetical protein
MNYFLSALCLFVLHETFAAEKIPAEDHALVKAVMDQSYIPVSLAGSVAVPFATAIFLFQQDNMLDRVQLEYGRLLPEGEKPEFVVQQESTNRWSYVNRKNQESVITEVYRNLANQNTAELLYHTTGKRFFGDFEALTHVTLRREENNETRFTLRVYAYPKVAVSRFLARHLGLVERYFADKTDELTALTVNICHHIINESEP